MKMLFVVLLLFVNGIGFGQATYERMTDEKGVVILKGLLAKDALDKEETFTWMKQDLSRYKADSNCVAWLRRQKDSIYIIVFAGTWCGDTQTILPQLFQLAEKSEFPFSRINIIGVDRMKKTIGTLAESLGITNVPTIIVMKKGKETGRVVEYGKYGLFDKELGEILQR